MAINTTVLMGRLTKEPELKTTQSGVSVMSFTIAVDRAYQKQGQERQTDFINCVAWRQTAEFINKYFRKGQMIAIVGNIQTRSYEDRDGNKRTAFEVIADNVSFCGGSNEQQGGQAERTERSEQRRPSRREEAPGLAYEYGYNDIDDQELPF